MMMRLASANRVIGASIALIISVVALVSSSLFFSEPQDRPLSDQGVATIDRVGIPKVAAERASSAVPNIAERAITDRPETGAEPKDDVAADGVMPPAIDVIRIDATGSTVVAGKAESGTTVVIRLDGQAIADSVADLNGAFVSLIDLDLQDAPQVLSVESRDARGAVTPAEASVIVAPARTASRAGSNLAKARQAIGDSGSGNRSHVRDSAGPAGRELVRATAQEITATTSAATTRSGSESDREVGVAKPENAPSSSGVATVTDKSDGGPRTTAGLPEVKTNVPLSDLRAGRSVARVSGPPLQEDAGSGDGSHSVSTRVGGGQLRAPSAQPPPRLFRIGPDGIALLDADADAEAAPRARQELAIEVISYDAAGEVRITGHAGPDVTLRIYLDGAPVLEAMAGPDGIWSAPLPGVTTGLYTLRIDAIAADGTVTDRVETPFQRTAPEIAAAARRDGATAITVQPGFTLWAISEGYFGNGARYVQLFEKNRDLIRDPDLIFPGQVFALPVVIPD